MKHFLVFYEFAPDYLERRGPHRSEHLRLAWDAVERGELLLGGPYADPADGGLLLFKGESPDAATRFVEADPYVRAGIVTRWHIRTWTTVIGNDASAPVRPE